MRAGDLSPAVTWPGREVDRPSPYNASVKNEWSDTPYRHVVYRETFIFTQ